MRTRSLLILLPLTLLTLGGGSLLDLVRARAQTTLEAEGPEINATGTGTAGRIVKWLTATSQGNSVLFENAGKIGIGTTTPTAKLTVRGAGAYNVANAARFDLFNSVANQGYLQHVLDNGLWQLATINGAQTRLVITSTGNVGIGTIAPEAKLQVHNGGDAVWGISTAGTGVYGSSSSTTGAGVFGYSDSSIGVYGSNAGDGYKNTAAIYGISFGNSGIGVKGMAGYGAGGTGVWGISKGGNYAGYFNGKVHVTGNLTKGGGAFKIDHPLDPENKYLSHSFVESPDMMNIYNGNVMLGANGRATVHLPSYFSALNKDFRYQLTAIGAPGPNLHVAQKIRNNRFTIAGGSAGQEVSWQVTGIRQDAYANANRIVVEEDKPAQEQGFFLHPEVFGEPEEQGIQWGIRPEAMQQMQAERAAMTQELSPEEP